MKTFVLYGLRRPDDLVIRYVGITCQKLKDRLARHVNAGNKNNPHKDNWIEKTVKEGIFPEIVPLAVELTFEEACELEINMIQSLRNVGWPLLNISNGGEASMVGRKHTPETIEKLKKAQLGRKRKFSSEHRKNLSLSRIGMKFSQKHRKNLSACRLGKKMPEESNRKKRLALAGKPWSEARRKAYEDSKNI